MAYCYVLYSKTLDRFYIGSTQLEPENRLQLHVDKHYGENKFTAAADDWALFLTLKCDSLKQARNIEQHIKRMKSRTYICNLQKYDNLKSKLLNKYQTPGSPR